MEQNPIERFALKVLHRSWIISMAAIFIVGVALGLKMGNAQVSAPSQMEEYHDAPSPPSPPAAAPTQTI